MSDHERRQPRAGSTDDGPDPVTDMAGEERADADEGRAAVGPPELAELRRKVAEQQDQLMRTLADMENLRRRTRKERDDYTRYAVESLLRDLVPVLDNLDRALAAARGAAAGGVSAASLVQGVELTQRELLRVLERAGLTRYSALGHRFDPTRHEATARVVSPDQAPDTVVGEVVPGYLLHDRVLRAAQVAVAVGPDEDAA
jgi:molecular chaperone GrpE